MSNASNNGKRIKVGVFGAYRGMCMIDILAKHPDAELVAVCDQYTKLLDEVTAKAEKNGMKVAVYADFDEFFKSDMDAVVLANYAHEHAPYAVKFLNSGRHVMSEVLPCETPAQGVALVEAVENSGLVYAYAENYCYMDATFEMWRRRENGDVGDITYMEGEYIHDTSSIWPRITYGERDHWRNNMMSTFYCTHSIGPMLTISGMRPLRVVGFETPLQERWLQLGNRRGGSAGVELLVMENGAIAKSIHGPLKREPGSINYEIYGSKGMMETDRFDSMSMTAYIEGDKLCHGEREHYHPDKVVSAELAKTIESHGGSDFYATHFFLQKILGRPEGRYSIDVYTAMDMGLCGLLAMRSVLRGNAPIDVPNFRNKKERDLYRYDNMCTNPKIARPEELIPPTSYEIPYIPDEVYDNIKSLWEAGKDAE